MDSWKERSALLVLLAGPLLILGLYGRVGSYLIGTLLIAWLTLLALQIRSGALFLGGPVLAYDMIRIGRRPANFRMRTLFALVLGVSVAGFYFLAIDDWQFQSRNSGASMPLKVQARVGERLFGIVIVMQFLFICVLTPGYVAGAIAEEKERKTLEFLLATDLRSSEIVFGKLASRVANLLTFVLAGLPVMGVALLFGGIDPDRLLICYAITLISIVSLSSVSIYASVRRRRARDGIGFAYALVVGYLVLTFLPFLVMDNSATIGIVWNILGYEISPFEWANRLAAGHPIWQWFYFRFLTESAGRGGVILHEIFQNYFLFHALVTIACLGYSGLMLRSVALAQLYNPKVSRSFRGRTRTPKVAKPLPPVGDYPMYWKEVHVQGGRGRMKGISRFLLMLVFCSAPPIFIEIYYENQWRYYRSQHLLAFTKLAGTIGVSLLLLRIAIRGAGCISGERDQHTLDELLTTPLTTREILIGKWAGCVLSMKSHWLFLILLWAIAVLSGGLHWTMFFALIACTGIQAVAFAGLGLVCSITARTTNRAILVSILWGLFQGGLVVLLFYAALASISAADRKALAVAEIAEFAAPFAPPAATLFLTMNDLDDTSYRNLNSLGRHYEYVITGLCTSIFYWLSLIFLFWCRLRYRFAKLANRLPYTPETPVYSPSVRS